MKKPLNIWTFFSWEIDFDNFKKILSTLNHVKPVYISRTEYDALYWDILTVVGNDTVWDIFELSLPEDLKKSELLELTFFLTQKFRLEEYAWLEKLISKVKLYVELILRNLPEVDKADFMQNIIEQSHISPELLSLIEKQKLLFWPTKEVLKSFEWEELSQDELLLELQDILEKEFYLTFFRKWVNMLRLGMMTITAWEIPAIKKKDGNIKINIPSTQLDKQERLLRQKIRIDELKIELENARNLWKENLIQSIEKKAVNRIMYVLYEYPYQVTSNDYWFQPSKILETKELYCTGLSILWHAFLTELGIEHYGLSEEYHTALEVVIWKQRYLFDVTATDKLLRIESLWLQWYIEKIRVSEMKPEIFYIQKSDVQDTLMSHILYNIWNKYMQQEDYKTAIIFFSKAMYLNKNCWNFYLNIADCYHYLGKNKKACEYIETAIDLYPISWEYYNNYWVYLAQLEKYEQAIIQYKEAIKLNKNYSWAYINMATSYYHLWDYETSISLALQAGMFGWMNAEIYNSLWLSYIKQWKIQEAIDAFIKSINEKPSDSYYYNNMWLALEDLGNKKIAKLFYFATNVIDNISKKKKLSNDEKMITQFIQNIDFDWLAHFMLNLIKNSN